MKRTPYKHQVEATDFAVKRNGACFWMKMRTGKTLATVHAIAKANAFPCLIIAPKAIMPVWKAEFLLEGADPRLVDIVEGPKQKRIKMLQHPAPVVIANYEMITAYRLFDCAEWGSIVIDESLKIGNIGTKRTLACLDYIESRMYPKDQMRFCLSGSPASESPFQLVPQMFFVLGNFMGYKSWEKYIMENWRYNKYSYKWEPIRKAHLAEIKKFNQENAFHCDLGFGKDTLRRRLEVEPTEHQKRLINTIRESETYTREGETLRYTPMVRAGFELQVCAGRNPFTGEIFDKSRIRQIIEWCIDTEEPCLVVTRYRKGFIEAFVQEAEALSKGKLRVGTMVGSQADLNQETLSKFQAGVLDVIIGQAEVVSEGLDFSRASVIHYLSNSYSQNTRAQSEARCTNLKKKEPTELIDYVTRGCLDGALVDLLEKKADLSSQYVEEWRNKKIT